MRYFITAFAVLFALISCGEGEGCKDLTWESDGYTADSQVSLKASAGDKCENYNDYWDGDLNQIIEKIQSMKIMLNRKCYEMTSVDSDPEEIEVECPEFVPETIESGELVKCSFETPPSSMTNCRSRGSALYFKNEKNVVLWMLLGMNNPIIDTFQYEIDGVKVDGSFNDETLTSGTVKFTWTEDEEEKTLEFSAKVEIKE